MSLTQSITRLQAYLQHGYPQAIREHHQGEPRAIWREIVVNPATTEALTGKHGVAWNPSLPDKIEDTFVILRDGGLENLTFDPNWPSVEVEGRNRPVPLETA